MPLQGTLGIERMCQLAGVSRRSFYRSLKEPPAFCRPDTEYLPYG
jgi:predicted DNA-binding transcriptional regulator AlpA